MRQGGDGLQTFPDTETDAEAPRLGRLARDATSRALPVGAPPSTGRRAPTGLIPTAVPSNRCCECQPQKNRRCAAPPPCSTLFARRSEAASSGSRTAPRSSRSAAHGLRELKSRPRTSLGRTGTRHRGRTPGPSPASGGGIRCRPPCRPRHPAPGPGKPGRIKKLRFWSCSPASGCPPCSRPSSG